MRSSVAPNRSDIRRREGFRNGGGAVSLLPYGKDRDANPHYGSLVFALQSTSSPTLCARHTKTVRSAGSKNHANETVFDDDVPIDVTAVRISTLACAKA